MMRYSVQHRDRIFHKGYGFLSFAKNVCKNIGKNISKNLSGKYSQNLLDHAKQPPTIKKKVPKESIYIIYISSWKIKNYCWSEINIMV